VSTDLDAMLKRLHLPTIRRLYAELALRAEAEGMSYRDFLEILTAEEIAHRAQTRITRSVRRARFPYLRTIEDFDFTFQTSVRLQMLGTLLGPSSSPRGAPPSSPDHRGAGRRTSPSPSPTARSRTASRRASPRPTR
jgi:hypothetical protein